MRPARGAVAVGVASLVATLGLAGLRHAPSQPPLQAAEDLLLDLRFRLRGPRPPSERVLIVAIDDADLARIGLMAPMRAALAQAVPRMLADGAAAVVVDLLLVEPTAADAKLAAALSARPGAVLAVAATAAAGPPPTPVQRDALRASAFPVIAVPSAAAAAPAPAALLAPTDGLVAAAALGHVNVARAADRVARRAPLAIDLDGGVALPSAALVAARAALGAPPGALALWRGESVRLGPRTIPTDAAGQVTLNHFGGPGTLDTVSLGAVLDGRVAPADVAGRVVFIGAGVDSLGDVFATPYAADVAGVEILATLAANLMDEESIRGGQGLASTGLALAGAGLVGLAVAGPASPVLAAAATLAVALAAGLALQAAFLGGAALDAVTVLGAIALTSGLHWARRLRTDRAGALRLDAARRRATGFLSPFAAANLPSDGPGPAWRSEPATIGFVDVEGSVGIAEHRSPEATAAILAEAQGTIARAASRHGGAVVERFGDGALVVFGFGGGGGPREALAFARDLAAGVGVTGPTLRVSLHHGPVALADLGGGMGGHVTVAGDTVNVAARLQDSARRAGASVAVSRAALDAAGVDPVAGPGDLRPLAPETLRGRSGAVEVWVLGG